MMSRNGQEKGGDGRYLNMVWNGEQHMQRPKDKEVCYWC